MTVIGAVAEWLGGGLQNLLDRFDSGRYLQSADGGIGRRCGLKIRCLFQAWGFESLSAHQICYN